MSIYSQSKYYLSPNHVAGTGLGVISTAWFLSSGSLYSEKGNTEQVMLTKCDAACDNV